MAKVTMDDSEYELLKENKKLLENSLEKERSLQKEIETLNRDKIKALENANMRVVKINKSEIREFKLIKRDGNQAVNALYRYFRVVDDLPSQAYNYDVIHNLIEQMFETVESISTPNEDITTHGLDEIKKELSDIIRADFEDDIKKANEIKEHSYKLNDEVISFGKQIDNLNSINSILLDNETKLLKENKELKNDQISLGKIADVMSEFPSFGKRSRALSVIEKIVDDTLENKV